MNIYRKYRPQEFSEMIGNRDEIESLELTLNRENRPHVYLFHGVSGGGKTTAARIVAKHLGADEISISEINSSSNRGIDTARQIIEQMRSIPFGGVQVYIIDEIHQTSKDFQNALLKPLEDTPDYVYFFLCTTNPEKLILPLRTRCSEFKFPALDKKNIVRLLKRINREEEKLVEDDVMEEIAIWAEGSPRKALVLYEKIMEISSEKALKVLEKGITDEEDGQTIELCRALLNKSATWGSICEVIKNMNDSDYEKVRYAVLGYMGNTLLSGKENNRAAVALESFQEPWYNSGKAGLILACYNVLHVGQ